MAFGHELRERRLGQGVSLTELSKLTHYSKGHLSKIETGGKRASEDLARRCDEALEASGELLAAHCSVSTARSARTAFQRPAQLPLDRAHFIGRHGETAALDRAASRPDHPYRAMPLVVIDGMPGVGKTALALKWAHRNAALFPDGVLFHHLRAHGPAAAPAAPDDVLAASLRAVGIDDHAIPAGLWDRAALYRTALTGRRMLIVLDDAATADQVRALLPGAPGCMVLVTSRNRLAGLVARDGAARLSLGPLSCEDASALLRGVAGAALHGARPEAVSALSDRCGHLPLALRIAAEHFSAGPQDCLEGVVGELSDPRGRLDFLSCAGDTAASVRAVFSWSYRSLPQDVARAFRLIGAAAPEDISPQGAARVLGVPEDLAVRLAQLLCQVNLLQPTASGGYRCNTLLAAYAAELAAA
ncbi:helix-turn-helix domain-containing protein [Streptomyces sp. NBC_00091]|uniref:helix-turn-helix domain-containing protein n=1 Tax=Streptomyces sp. NBC_00091 TaxID=2975648 RepID=UPI00225B2404|nr:helix-turn-helix domain-containing protein [Streptomyces sp. NBC_00091]MCX5379757.1 helix-turn-helix domain-containing protein [Streptomyces sp. NBC_00091]